MKYFLIILFIFGLNSSLYASIDERKIDVYFANGINITDGEAWDNARLIKKKHLHIMDIHVWVKK